MQTETDPYPGGVPALPEYMTGELERIRYQLMQIMGNTYWYEDPVSNIRALWGQQNINTGNIAANAANIAANAGDIATNIANIAANLALIQTHAARHAAGGADALPNNAINSAMIADGAIMNVDINAAAAIAWSKIAVPGSVVYDNVAETITGGWTITTADWAFYRKIFMQTGYAIDFYDDDGDFRMRAVAYDDEARLWTNDCYLYMRDLTRAYLLAFIEVQAAHNVIGGLDPTINEGGSLGWVNTWYDVLSCNFNDICSDIRVPKRALETLNTLMLEEIGAKVRDEPDAHVLKTTKLPAFLRDDRPKDPKTGKEREPMRNLSATVSFLQGCVYELEQRLTALEQG